MLDYFYIIIYALINALKVHQTMDLITNVYLVMLPAQNVLVLTMMIVKIVQIRLLHF